MSQVALKIGGVAAFVGLALAFSGFQNMSLASVAQSEPQTLTAAELGSNGFGDNANVLLEDFFLCDNFVYESKSDSAFWTTVWIPAVPLGGTYHQQVVEIVARAEEAGQPLPAFPAPPPGEVRVIFKFTGQYRQSSIERMYDREQFRGLVINEIASITGEERSLLAQSYPGVDLSGCYIFEPDRRVPTGGGAMLMLGLLIAGGGGAIAFFFGLKKKAPPAPRRRSSRKRGPRARDESDDDDDEEYDEFDAEDEEEDEDPPPRARRSSTARTKRTISKKSPRRTSRGKGDTGRTRRDTGRGKGDTGRTRRREGEGDAPGRERKKGIAPRKKRRPR